MEADKNEAMEADKKEVQGNGQKKRKTYAQSVALLVSNSELVSGILSRLPVRNIQMLSNLLSRRDLISERHFMYLQSSQAEYNLLVQFKAKNGRHTFSMLRTVPEFHHLRPDFLPKIEILGSIKGIFGVFCPLNAPAALMLWNPSITKSLLIPFPVSDEPPTPLNSSLALAFDSLKKEFIVMRVRFMNNAQEVHYLRIKNQENLDGNWVCVKSFLDLDLQKKYKCDLIFKEEPYWLAQQSRNDGVKQHVILKFDIRRMKLIRTALESFSRREERSFEKILVNIGEKLGILNSGYDLNSNYRIEGWVLDGQCKRIWSITPSRRIDRVIGFTSRGYLDMEFSNSGYILAQFKNQLVFLVIKGQLGGMAAITLPIGPPEDGDCEVYEMLETVFQLDGMN